jgi:hypothetical protein
VKDSLDVPEGELSDERFHDKLRQDIVELASTVWGEY